MKTTGPEMMERVVEAVRGRRIHLVANLAKILGVHPNTVRWRVTMGRYRAEVYGERQTWVLAESVLEDLAAKNPGLAHLFPEAAPRPPRRGLS